MGHSKKRELLIELISTYLRTNISLMRYYHYIAPNRKSKFACNKSIKNTEKAIEHLKDIKHTELLEYLYSSFIGNQAIAYSVSGNVVLADQLAYYDTKDGFVEFQKEMEEQRKKRIEADEQRQKNLEAVKKAKEQGKNVEMVYNKDTKKVEPLIVEEKAWE